MTFTFASHLQGDQLLFQGLSSLEAFVNKASELIFKEFASGNKLMHYDDSGSVVDSHTLLPK